MSLIRTTWNLGLDFNPRLIIYEVLFNNYWEMREVFYYYSISKIIII